MFKKSLLLVVLSVAALVGCSRPADVASHNLSVAADNFEIKRRIVFYNGITNSYMLSIEGLCALDSSAAVKAITVTCRTGPSEFKKHYLGLSDNVTYFAEQLNGSGVGLYHYQVQFQPSTIIPDIRMN